MNAWARFMFAVFSVLCLSGCNEEWNWHQKLTVSVITPTGLKVGSSVQRGTIVKYGWWGQQWGYGGAVSLSGEAPVLEVAPGKFLFALITTTPNAWTIFVPEIREMEHAGPALVASRESRELTSRQYPLLITFEDINDPASVKRVDPAHLEASFGSNYRLNSIAMTITDERVTDGRLEKVLNWLHAVGKDRGTLIPNPPRRSTELVDPAIQLLSPSDFSTELYK